ncbi:MAG: SAM-dependent methyltransferase [Thermoplasmata archaeon]|jgi:precorrin-6B methylase 2|nr:SAM-dependent methyltransferase [Thermoplasmata archaeon]
MAFDPLLLFGLILVGIAVIAYFVFASFAYGAGYQPTPRSSVLTMLRLAEVGPQDTLYDLGAGTGAIVFRAARIYRARVVGVEVEPIRVAILRLRRRSGPFADRITIRWGNLFDLDFREATVVTAFLWPGAMARLRPKLEAELPAGARVVSHCHKIEGWTPEVYDPETDVYFYRRPRAPPATGGT